MRYFLFACCLILMSWGCKSTKKIESPKGAKLSASKVEKQLLNADIPAEWMYSKGRLKVDLPEINTSGSYRLYLQRDSALWMQVTKFGIEFGRVLITPDSLIALNRMENTYIKGGVEDIRKIFGSAVSFDQLQKLIWGQAPIFKKGAEIKNEKSYFLVSGTDRASSVSYLYSITAPFEIISGLLTMESDASYGQQSLEFSNDDFQELTNNYYFPYLRNYHLVSPSTEIKIEMSVQNVELGEEKELRIEVPAHYTPYNN